MAVSIRPVISADAEGLRAIYNVEVLDSTVTMDLVARTLDEQLAWIDRHGGAHPAIVAEEGPAIVGFASLSPWRDRPAYRGTVENSVYVARTAQGRGIGRLLLSQIVQLGAEHGFHTCMARIAGGNDASVRLHIACRFELVGVERQVGRKLNRWIDVTVMQRML